MCAYESVLISECKVILFRIPLHVDLKFLLTCVDIHHLFPISLNHIADIRRRAYKYCKTFSNIYGRHL